jgi:hypothetical protein
VIQIAWRRSQSRAASAARTAGTGSVPPMYACWANTGPAQTSRRGSAAISSPTDVERAEPARMPAVSPSTSSRPRPSSARVARISAAYGAGEIAGAAASQVARWGARKYGWLGSFQGLT